MHNISSLYFGYRPVAGHAPGCSREGTNQWEAMCFTRERFGSDEPWETTLRFFCSECGHVVLATSVGEPTMEYTHVSRIGYGAKPERVAGLWLHPGPVFRYYDDRGPTAFYVTRGKDRPRVPADVLGVVGWHLGKRGGVRWSAGLGCTDYGSVRTDSGQDFGSRRAAVAWIAAQPEGAGE
jgi:hypothetical protein